MVDRSWPGWTNLGLFRQMQCATQCARLQCPSGMRNRTRVALGRDAYTPTGVQTHTRSMLLLAGWPGTVSGRACSDSIVAGGRLSGGSTGGRSGEVALGSPAGLLWLRAMFGSSDSQVGRRRAEVGQHRTKFGRHRRQGSRWPWGGSALTTVTPRASSTHCGRLVPAPRTRLARRHLSLILCLLNL